MRGKLDNRTKLLVGLIMILPALLFLSSVDELPKKEDFAFWNKWGKETEVQETVKEEPEEEPVEEPKPDPELPILALTFDDGPGTYTEELLNILKENNAKATFFVVGSNVVKHPETVKKIEELGFEIGNHTYGHGRLTELTPEGIQQVVEGTNDALKQVIGHGAALVRPPYGAVNEAVHTYVAYPLAMWSVDTEDWRLKDAAAITEYILGNVKDGDVVLIHDIHDFSVEAMRTVIPALKERGYQLVTFSEMAEARGVTMENGQKYFHFHK